MTSVLINAMASTAGGGITYLRNVLPRLNVNARGHDYLVLVPAEHAADYAGCAGEKVRIETAPVRGNLPARLWWEQTGLRGYLKLGKIDVLVSLGNFALFASPVPQILFNRNDLYFSDYFVRDLRSRGRYGQLIGHIVKSHLARASIRQADTNVAPTKAFADRIRAVTGSDEDNFEVLHFGFDPNLFTSGQETLPADQLNRLNLNDDCFRLLYVSHYNYFRNFETLIRALPAIRRGIKERTGKQTQLVLTTDLKRGAVYGGYDATGAAELIDRLGVRDGIAMLGGVSYQKLHRLYRLCHLFVCPSYSESFGHPLLESMASGVPVAAANLPVHREVCGDAAVYFDLFDEAALAERVMQVLTDPDLSQTMILKGQARVACFSWDAHVDRLEQLIDQIK